MKLRTKMVACMALVFLFFIFALTVALMGMQDAKSRFERFLEQDQVVLQSLTGLYAQGLQMGQALRNIVLDPGNKTGHKNLEDASNEFQKSYQLVINMPSLSPKARQTLLEVGNFREKQIELQRKVVGLAKDQQVAAIEALKRDETPVWREMRGRLLEMMKVKNAEITKIKADTIQTTQQMLIASLILASTAVLSGAGIAFWLIRNVMRQLGGEPDYAVDIAHRIAAGDLAMTIVTQANDHNSVLHAMKGMLDNLSTLVRQVHGGTDAIATATREIAASNLDLSSRTEQQASSLEETASSMQDLTSTVKKNAQNAHHAKGLAESASMVAKQGGDVVAQVVATMGSINDSSKKIADIIGVIDGLAFQTNILALNAAVEAARAGEQGRGFAVVAAEVRSLAQRSASAAKEIKLLISTSVEKVDAGTKLVDRAGITMDQVVVSVKSVSDIIMEIASASAEQTNGIAQISVAITQMDDVTQQNAALVEEAAGAAEALQEQAAKLRQLVNVFKLNDTARQAIPVRSEARLALGSKRR